MNKTAPKKENKPIPAAGKTADKKNANEKNKEKVTEIKTKKENKLSDAADKIKKGSNAFFIFVSQNRGKILKENPAIKQKDVLSVFFIFKF